MTDTKSKFKCTIHNKAFFFGGGGVESHKLFKCFFLFLFVLEEDFDVYSFNRICTKGIKLLFHGKKKALAKGQRPLQHFVCMTRS